MASQRFRVADLRVEKQVSLRDARAGGYRLTRRKALWGLGVSPQDASDGGCELECHLLLLDLSDSPWRRRPGDTKFTDPLLQWGLRVSFIGAMAEGRRNTWPVLATGFQRPPRPVEVTARGVPN